jgi:hypothetical protein
MAILSVPSHLIWQRQERREQRAAGRICPACRGLAAMQTRTELRAHHRPGEPHPQFSYMCTCGQVRVRVMPSSAWIWATTSWPSSSTLRASA